MAAPRVRRDGTIAGLAIAAATGAPSGASVGAAASLPPTRPHRARVDSGADVPLWILAPRRGLEERVRARLERASRSRSRYLAQLRLRRRERLGLPPDADRREVLRATRRQNGR